MRRTYSHTAVRPHATEAAHTSCTPHASHCERCPYGPPIRTPATAQLKRLKRWGMGRAQRTPSPSSLSDLPISRPCFVALMLSLFLLLVAHPMQAASPSPSRQDTRTFTTDVAVYVASKEASNRWPRVASNNCVWSGAAQCGCVYGDAWMARGACGGACLRMQCHECQKRPQRHRGRAEEQPCVCGTRGSNYADRARDDLKESRTTGKSGAQAGRGARCNASMHTRISRSFEGSAWECASRRASAQVWKSKASMHGPAMSPKMAIENVNVEVMALEMYSEYICEPTRVGHNVRRSARRTHFDLWGGFSLPAGRNMCFCTHQCCVGRHAAFICGGSASHARQGRVGAVQGLRGGALRSMLGRKQIECTRFHDLGVELVGAANAHQQRRCGHKDSARRKETRGAHQQSISRAPAEHQQSISRASAEHQQSISRASAEHQQSTSRASAEHQQSISRAPAEHQQSISRASAEHQQSVSRASAERQQSVSREGVRTPPAYDPGPPSYLCQPCVYQECNDLCYTGVQQLCRHGSATIV
jgi:hypothetical protein